MIGISTSWTASRNIHIRESVDYVASLGFEVIELGAAHKYETNIFQTLKEIRKEHPTIIFTVHATFPPPKNALFLNPCEGLTKNNKNMIDNAIKASKTMNAKVTSLHPGFPAKYKNAGPHPGMKGFTQFEITEKLDRKTSFENAIKTIRYYYEKANKAGLNLAIENNPEDQNIKPLLYYKDDFEKVFLQFPKLGLLFDYGHALKEYEDPCFLMQLNRTRQIHLHNCINGKDHRLFSKKDEAKLQRLFRFKIAKEIPVIFEFGGDVSEDEVLKQKKLAEKFL